MGQATSDIQTIYAKKETEKQLASLQREVQEREIIQERWSCILFLMDHFPVCCLDINFCESTPLNYALRLQAPTAITDRLVLATTTHETIIRQVRVQNWAAVRRLLGAGEGINGMENNARTPLFVAVGNSFSIPHDVLECLASEQNINLASDKGYTPLHASLDAIPRGDPETRMCTHEPNFHIVQFLMKRGADCDVLSAKGETPLLTYISEHQFANIKVPMLELLAGGVVNRHQLIMATVIALCKDEIRKQSIGSNILRSLLRHVPNTNVSFSLYVTEHHFLSHCVCVYELNQFTYKCIVNSLDLASSLLTSICQCLCEVSVSVNGEVEVNVPGDEGCLQYAEMRAMVEEMNRRPKVQSLRKLSIFSVRDNMRNRKHEDYDSLLLPSYIKSLLTWDHLVKELGNVLT